MASKPKVSFFDQMAARVPEIMDVFFTCVNTAHAASDLSMATW
jgi:hypothetical protein